MKGQLGKEHKSLFFLEGLTEKEQEHAKARTGTDQKHRFMGAVG